MLVVQKSKSVVGGIILNPVKAERSFSLNLLCTKLPHYAKKHKVACASVGGGFLWYYIYSLFYILYINS